jgi:hypothetical protein
MTGFKAAATVLGAFAIIVIAPTTAHATDNEPGGGASCSYTDADGSHLPMDDGQDVSVDGKIVSCRNGKVTVTSPPVRRNTVHPQIDHNAVRGLTQP